MHDAGDPAGTSLRDVLRELVPLSHDGAAEKRDEAIEDLEAEILELEQLSPVPKPEWIPGLAKLHDLLRGSGFDDFVPFVILVLRMMLGMWIVRMHMHGCRLAEPQVIRPNGFIEKLQNEAMDGGIHSPAVARLLLV
ncbi:MAG: hypothetical protein ACYTGZ_01465 [Planctomycetota bacterium]